MVKILAVDDNAMSLKIVERFLQEKDVEIDKAESGTQAIEMATEKAYDVLLIDYLMPEMDGVEIVETIHETGQNEKTTAFLMTGASEDEINDDVKSHFLYCFEKPILKEEFLEILAPYLGEKKDINTLMQRVPFLDVAGAMSYCGNSMEFFHEMLEMYVEASKVEAIERTYAQENWVDYEILVHGVKGVSRSIGATQVADAAYELELAQKRDDIAYIRDNHKKFISMYEELLGKIQKEV